MSRQEELDKAVEELTILNNATPVDSDAVAKANTKVDALRKALNEPEVKVVKPVVPVVPVYPVKPEPFKKF